MSTNKRLNIDADGWFFWMQDYAFSIFTIDIHYDKLIYRNQYVNRTDWINDIDNSFFLFDDIDNSFFFLIFFDGFGLAHCMCTWAQNSLTNWLHYCQHKFIYGMKYLRYRHKRKVHHNATLIYCQVWAHYEEYNRGDITWCKWWGWRMCWPTV